MVLSNLISDNRFSLKSLFQQIDEMVFLIKVEGDKYRCVEVNQAYLEQTGVQEENIVNKTIEEIVEGIEAEHVIGKYNEVIATGKTLSYEEDITLNGGKRTYETTLIPLHIETKKGSYIIGISRNVSTRKNYEEELLRSKEQLNCVIHHQQGVIFSVNKVDGEFIYTLFDGEVLQLMGLTPEQTVGKRPQDILGESLGNDVCKVYDECWITQEKIIFEEKCTRNHDWLTVINPMVGNGQTNLIIGSSIDITQRKVAERALLNSEKLSLLGELSAGIGHEINNPLTSVKGFFKIIKENNSNINKETLNIIENELETIERFSEELIMLARPQEHQKHTFDALSLVKEITNIMEVNEPKVQIEIKPSPGEFFIHGVRKQMKQALFNIMENAIESIDPIHGGKMLIECSGFQDELVILVTDNGSGIPEERLGSLGEPFYTTKDKGNGLGLMITNRIIKNHGGHVEIGSKVGEGTTVTVSLPLL
ncbi:ATP-binding protein [Bacillus sp. AK031]